MAEKINSAQINTVLRIVCGMTPNGDAQLSILAHALVIGCKSTEVDREVALEEINKLWDRPDPIVPLASTN